MKNQSKLDLVVVGSLALDTVTTPLATRRDILGGSVSFACAAAAFFARTGMVAVAGQDFPRAAHARLRKFNIDLRGLHKAAGKTFRWSGAYERNMNQRRTISTDLNVFADFSPQLPQSYRQAPFLFLANIAPDLQLQVLSQMRRPKFVAADTMDLWIRTARQPLHKLIARIDLLLVNDAEARLLTGQEQLARAAAKLLKWGPQYVIIKKGEHGSILASPEGLTLLPAYPLEKVQDPTGAGDAFAGGLLGCLAAVKKLTPGTLRQAMAVGTVVASFTVEAFGLNRLAAIKRANLDSRLRDFQRMIRL